MLASRAASRHISRFDITVSMSASGPPSPTATPSGWQKLFCMSTINNATLEGSTSALLFTGCPLARSWRAALSTREIDKAGSGFESSVVDLYEFNLGREDSRRALGDQETRHRLREVQGREQPAAVVLGSSQRGLNICRPDGLDAGRDLSE